MSSRDIHARSVYIIKSHTIATIIPISMAMPLTRSPRVMQIIALQHSTAAARALITAARRISQGSILAARCSGSIASARYMPHRPKAGISSAAHLSNISAAQPAVYIRGIGASE